MDFTIVTACTPEYLNQLVWALPTWVYKPQFQGKPIVIFHNYNETDPKELAFVKELFPVWTFVKWVMPKYDNLRELMLSSFILGIKEYVKTPYWVKLDADTFFTNNSDIFTEEESRDYDLVGHAWGYTKPGWWVDLLNGDPVDKSKKVHAHSRINSFCCLHKTEFTNKVAELCGTRLPVPSHDTVIWHYANKMGKWKGKNFRRLGVENRVNWRSIREMVCSSPSHDNPRHNRLLMTRVQLELTTDCNLKCHNCDRVCGIAPSKETMSLEQIWKFVEESLKLKHRWSRIDLIGGETTMYPDFQKMLEFIKVYKDRYPRCRIRLSTNGLGPQVNEIIKTIPSWVSVRNSAKVSRIQPHTAFNSAPIDNGEKKVICCSVPWRCGVALTRYGYFLCGGGASIARVFGLDICIKNLRDVSSKVLLDQVETLCKFCGHSQVRSRHITDKQEISPSWEKAIAGYRDVKLELY